MFVDSHCHINDEILLLGEDEVIKRANEKGVSLIMVVGYDLESSKKAVEIASRHDGVYAAVGFHPENLEGVSDEALLEIEELTKNDKVVAIGEIGLDYHWFKEEKDRQNQKKWFIKQIEMANRLHLPLSIHARDASEDTFEILNEHRPLFGAVLHCYSGSVEMMKRFETLDLYFGFDGPITFKNAVGPKECVKACREDRILTETDSPYMAPTPYRGKTNEPQYIVEIIAQMAYLREVSVGYMENKVEENFRRLFLKK